MPPITRFAPSPTGLLHLGGARTALFNFIFAKSKNGLFKVRIEDTDKIRNTEKSVSSIINGLNWLGLNSDSEIIYQKNNITEHIKVAHQMIENGFAYKCYHDDKEIQEMKTQKKKIISIWRDKKKSSTNEKFCIRVKSPQNGITEINDQIQGKVKVNNVELDDYIIIRTDGTPTFLLSSAIDDYLMSVTDIIRGDDHLTNSFRQMIIFNFLNYQPNFAHIPLIHNENNQKLSKRDNVLSIDDYQKSGYLPIAIINYMLRMGWSIGDQEFITLNEAINSFEIQKVGKSPSIIDEKKLIFFNNFYLKNSNEAFLFEKIKKFDFKEKNDFLDQDSSIIKESIKLFKDRSNSLVELIESIKKLKKIEYLYNDYEKEVFKKTFNNKSIILDKLSGINSWNNNVLENTINDIIKSCDLKFKDVAQPLRLSLIGILSGPSVSELMRIIGKEKSLKKILLNWN